jgi:hypothetical protein
MFLTFISPNHQLVVAPNILMCKTSVPPPPRLSFKQFMCLYMHLIICKEPCKEFLHTVKIPFVMQITHLPHFISFVNFEDFVHCFFFKHRIFSSVTNALVLGPLPFFLY